MANNELAVLTCARSNDEDVPHLLTSFSKMPHSAEGSSQEQVPTSAGPQETKRTLYEIALKQPKMCNCAYVQQYAERLLKKYTTAARCMFGVGWMETEEYHGYSTPQAGVDSNMGVFKADMKDLIGYANGTYEGKICRGCRKGKEQLEEEKRGVRQKEIQELCEVIQKLKLELEDPAKQMEREIAEAENCWVALQYHKNEWLRQLGPEEDAVATTPQVPAADPEVDTLKDEIRKLKRKIEGPGERTDGFIQMVKSIFDGLKMDKKKWLVDHGLEEKEVVWFP